MLVYTCQTERDNHRRRAQMAMTTEQQVSILAVITTSDEAGRHFTAV